MSAASARLCWLLSRQNPACSGYSSEAFARVGELDRHAQGEHRGLDHPGGMAQAEGGRNALARPRANPLDHGELAVHAVLPADLADHRGEHSGVEPALDRPAAFLAHRQVGDVEQAAVDQDGHGAG